MTVLILIVVALVAVVAIYFFTRSQTPTLPDVEEPPKLPETTKPAEAKPAAPAEAKPAEAKPVAETKPAEAKPAVVEAKPVETKPVAEAKPAETKPAVVEAKPVEAPVTPPAPSVESRGTTQVTPPTPAETAPAAPVVEAPVVRERLRTPRDLTALKKGLAQARTGWMQRIFAVFSGRKEIDPALLESMEETLLTGDVGTVTTRRLVDALKERLDRKELTDEDTVWQALKAESLRILEVGAKPFGEGATTAPLVILMVGINGAGKTTTIAKLAGRYKDHGRSVLLAAADTFRAAAVQQLEMWGKRVGVPVYKGKEGAKPSAVVYEAVAQGVRDKVDVIIADTAGRLQNKAPLMEELRKIRDAAGKAHPGAPHEILLVLDATTGQNAVSQAREFRETLDVTGVVLTKLDGTAKGGVILAVADEFKLPVRFVGVGEKSDDLREFDAQDFVDALFVRGEDEAQ